ncbi:type II toxin-antitoxin system RelB/DinJ family antitoxin [Photorhabdus asymbiotica]|uniref:type II toxin-antitoxin system RelB/DinJ family antitoxin n=1 Tax=Photorhabdus asymbiotica TaxID=291112 RepID=UPI003DA78920
MATINARIDDDIKAQADGVLKTLDISHTQAISALYQYIASNGRLPFLISMQVRTPEDIESKIMNQFREASTTLNTIKKNLELSHKLEKNDTLKKNRKLKNIHINVWNEIPQTGHKNILILLADVLKKAISTLEDFKNSGYGYEVIMVSEEECRKFSAAVESFDLLITKDPEGISEDDMAEDDIVTLDQEVARLYDMHEASLKDSTLTMEERKAITNEYIAKYNKLKKLGLNRVSVDGGNPRRLKQVWDEYQAAQTVDELEEKLDAL